MSPEDNVANSRTAPTGKQRADIEEHREDLTGGAALERLRGMIEDASTCFFCTAGAVGPSRGVRPMGVERIDDDGTMWFLSGADSAKNRELAERPQVELFFQGGKHSDFLHLIGRAEVSRDRAQIASLWKPIHRTWFTEGEDDPRITVIRVTPQAGYYWDTRNGTAVAGIKMLLGAATGRTMDDSVEGTLQV